MYINKTTLEAVSGFTAFGSEYWSSTEFVNNTAWYQDFDYGFQIDSFKYITFNVRAVRAFQLFNYLSIQRSDLTNTNQENKNG